MNRRPPSAELSWGELADIEQAWTAVLDADHEDDEADYVIKLCRTIRELCVERDKRDAGKRGG